MPQNEVISGSNRAIRTLSKVDFKEKYSNKKINSMQLITLINQKGRVGKNTPERLKIL